MIAKVFAKVLWFVKVEIALRLRGTRWNITRNFKLTISENAGIQKNGEKNEKSIIFCAHNYE